MKDCVPDNVAGSGLGDMEWLDVRAVAKFWGVVFFWNTQIPQVFPGPYRGRFLRYHRHVFAQATNLILQSVYNFLHINTACFYYSRAHGSVQMYWNTLIFITYVLYRPACVKTPLGVRTLHSRSVIQKHSCVKMSHRFVL